LLKATQEKAALEDTAAALTAAIAVLEGANLVELEGPVRALDGSPHGRPRLFFRASWDVPEGDGGGRRGGDDD
jgi:hypothetical protein